MLTFSMFLSKQLDADLARESVVKMSIFYEKLAYTHSSESAKVSTSALFAYLGGTLSLFLGVSVLSVCEVVYVLVEVYYIKLKSKTCVKLACKTKNIVKNQNSQTIKP